MTLEACLRGVVAGLLLFVAGTGVLTFFWTTPPPFVQIIQLAHLIAGFALVAAGVAYVMVHLRATVGSLSVAARALPRAPAFAVGWVFIYAAGLMIVNPSREARAIANPVLGISSLVALGLIFIYGVRVVRTSGTRTTVIGAVALLAVVAATVAAAFLAFGFILYTGLNSPRAAHAVFAPIAVALVAWHIRSSRRTSVTKVRVYSWAEPLRRVALPTFGTCLVVTAVAGARLLSRTLPSGVDTGLLVPIDADFAQRIPASCSPCHPEPVAGWSSSSHRYAAKNPVFTALVKRLAKDRGPTAIRNCLRCHAPHAPDPATAPLEKVLASKGYANGVHCVSCHRTAPGDAHGDGSLVATPLVSDPFWFVTDRLPPPPDTSEMFLNALVLSRIRLHRATFSTKPENARVCLPCHVQTLTAMTGGRLTHTIQDQYDSWAASRFAASGQDCAPCHMPRYMSKDRYLVVDHRLRAASTYVTAVAAGEKGLEEVVTALHGGSSLPPPTFEDPPRPVPGPLLSLRVTRKHGDGGEALLVTTEGTGRIGHSFPNGPTDLVQTWLALRATDGAGKVLLDVGRDGPENAPRLGHTFEDSAGQPIRDHRLWAIERVIEHGRIPPDGTHEHVVPLPAGATTGPLHVEAAWRYRRLDPAVAAGLGEARAWMLPTIDLATFTADDL